MKLSDEEVAARKRLVAFCENCEEWYKFVDDLGNPSVRLCPDCGSRPSSKVGFQLTTQRTFNPRAKKLTKAQLKKMGGLGS